MQDTGDLREKLLDKGNEEGAGGDIDMKMIFNNEYNTSAHASEKYFKQNCKSVEHLKDVFKTDFINGLSSSNKDDLEWRENKWGNNKLPPEKENSILAHIIECFEDPTLRVLLIASIVSLIIGVAKDGLTTGWIEGTAIFFAVFLVVSISSYMNYQETEQFLKLSRETKLKKVLVIRDSKEKEISIEDVLVGDILKLRIGDIINVDGFVFGDAKAGMDESPVTGESDVMWKVNNFELKGQKYSCPFVFSGSQVVDGYGNMVVAAVGDKTFEGSNKQLNSATGSKGEDDEDNNLTPLKKQLNELSNLIGDLGYLMAILIGIVLFLKETIINITLGISIWTSHELDVLVNAFIIAVTVIVVAIPEGLPMAVTIALAYSVDKMKREHNLVKHLDKSEAMGNVNNVCTDKTGTLTLGVMRVTAFFIEGQDIKLSKEKINDNGLRDLIWNCVYKNITCVETQDDKGNTVLNGDMTEKALYTYLKEASYPLEGNRKGLYVLPFKSDYKYMMNIYKDEDGYILYAKGAPERVGEFFTKFRVAGGQEENYEDHKAELFEKQAEYAEDSMRTLIFGYKKLTEEEINQAKEANPDDDLKMFQELAKGLCFAFMVGIRDDNRPDVPEAIKKCHHAGITVRMVTGDNINTAIAISKDVGIIEPSEAQECKRIAKVYRELVEKDKNEAARGIIKGDNPIALEGEIFRVICGGITKEQAEKGGDLTITLNNRDAFIHTVKKLKVIARASPEDKFILVFGLKELGNIVAVTGDGTNDAPALKQAHVGFAMGIRGTDIAKDAADVVLLDDSFSSIVTACKYGRNVYDCIRKFVQFQLTTNIVAVFMTFLGGIILKDSPLNAIQMLWVNLIMDSFASLALATEDPTDALLDRKPYSREASILTPMMKLNIVSQAIFQITTLTIIIFYGDYIFGVPSDRNLEHFMWNNVNGYHFTIFFNIFVFMQVFNSINARKLQKDEYNVFTGILGNWLYILIQTIIIVGQVLLVSIGGRAVRTHPLTLKQHGYCLGISALTLVWGFFMKLLPIDVSEEVTEGEEQHVKKPDTYKKTVSLGYMSRGQMKMGAGVRGLNSNASRVKKNN